MIKANLSNATRHKAILGLKRPACSAAFTAFCATLGLGSAVAVADTFNVSTAAEFQAALNEAAVNGQDDTIILAAGTYSTAGNLSFTYTREETEGAPYVSDYGIMTEDPPDHAPFVYRHRFDDDVAGYNTCPKSGGQVCTEPYSLTITGAGEGATILDGGGTSSALVFNLSFARPPEQEGVYASTAVYDHGGLLFVPDWDRGNTVGFIGSTADTTDDCTSAGDQPCNELMATLPAGIDDSGVLITVSDLSITNGLYSYGGSDTRQKATWRGCYHLHPSANMAAYDGNSGAWYGEDCAASGLSLISRNASLRLAGVTFTDNSASLAVNASHDSAALVADTLGGNITVDDAVFVGNRNNHLSADQYGGAASLRSRIGDITVNNSVFGDGTAEGANSVEEGSEGGALRAMVGPALEWDTRDFRYSWRVPLRDDIDALNEARYEEHEEVIDAGGNESRSGELFPSDRAIGGKITVTGSSFLGNVIADSSNTNTNTKGGYGGGASLISHYGSRGVTVSDSVFTGNTSPSKGGGLAIEAKSGTVLIEDSTFTDNFAGDQGAGIYVNSEVLVTIRNNIVTDNTVDGVSTTEGGIGDGTGLCQYDCEGGGIFARGVVSLIQNTITGNTITPNGSGSAYDGMGGGAAILAAGTPGEKLEIHRNHIGNNTTRFGTGGLYVISKHHDVTLTSNFIHDNTNTENVNDRHHDESMRVGGGVSVRSQTGTINFVNNTVANNTMVHDWPSGVDNVLGNSFYNYPSGGVYLSVEANEAKNWDTADNDNHPNYRHDLPTGYGEYLVGPAQANVYNNNFWNNTVIDASGGFADIVLNEGQAAATGTPPNGGLVDLILDNLTVYDDREFDSPLDTGSVVNVFNNNFSTPENYYIACDPETMTCQQLAGANISVDPQFRGEGPPFNDAEDGITQAPELSGSNDPNAPDQPEEDFFGNPIQGIGGLWEALAELIPVPVMGNLGLALLGLLLMVFGVRRLRAATAG